MEFDSSGATAETIREEDSYSGIRVTLGGTLSRAAIRFHVDVNVGDPIWPGPQQLNVPRLIGGMIVVRGYPLEMVLAEKIVTALERGTVSTRWRDFVDIYVLTGRYAINAQTLKSSLQRVAEFRNAELAPLRTALNGYAAIAYLALWDQRGTQRRRSRGEVQVGHQPQERGIERREIGRQHEPLVPRRVRAERKTRPRQKSEHQDVGKRIQQKHGARCARRQVLPAQTGGDDGRRDAQQYDEGSEHCAQNSETAMPVDPPPHHQHHLYEEESDPAEHHGTVGLYQGREIQVVPQLIELEAESPKHDRCDAGGCTEEKNLIATSGAREYGHGTLISTRSSGMSPGVTVFSTTSMACIGSRFIHPTDQLPGLPGYVRRPTPVSHDRKELGQW